MEKNKIYKDIATRTGGDIYIGVVGPVRTGKSTFIKKFMDNLVIPNINDDFQRERANDELPQSAAGRTIMTTEPKFIPEEAVNVTLDSNASFNVRLIDCVGYIVPSAIGYIEDETPRMVMTPWYDEPIPFNMAAEIGTKKVITEHSTIGLVITTDGSISDIERDEYKEAEERVINELKEINKPFIILMNCMYPESENVKSMCNELTEKYNVPVLPVNCLDLDEAKIREIISKVLFCFPVKEIRFDIPKWINSLGKDDKIKSTVFKAISENSSKIEKISDCNTLAEKLCGCELIEGASLSDIDLGIGSVKLKVNLLKSLFYDVISEKSGMTVKNDRELMDIMCSLAATKSHYDRIKDALEQVEATGYGIVMPTIEELKLEPPEIMKQGGRYGVRLKASAPSIHLMKANISTEVSPIVGSEKQSEDLVMSLMSEFDEDPLKIWDSNIFGKSLNELVNEGLHSKLARLPEEARLRLSQTLERLINEGCSGLICIIL
ncbi:MAG: stage IV sporulation protein A [Acutalibacteraceae bacterium]|nr:stage IV sporulation protein A [Acutalibacteraceae bacterium]